MFGMKPAVEAFHDRSTGAIQYVVADPITNRCAIVDPVLDFDERSGAMSTANADALMAYVDRKQLTLEWILGTHPHADHLSAAAYLKDKAGAAPAIGRHVVEVQELWKDIYNFPDFLDDGSQWDRLFDDGDTFWIGMLPVRMLHSPGHTPASVTYLIGDGAFVHDTLFMPDSGTARCDFPGGSAACRSRTRSGILNFHWMRSRLLRNHAMRRPSSLDRCLAGLPDFCVLFATGKGDSAYAIEDPGAGRSLLSEGGTGQWTSGYSQRSNTLSRIFLILSTSTRSRPRSG